MMRPGHNYRMSKSGKIHLAFTWNRPNQAQRRRTIILGELYGAQVIKSKRDREAVISPP